MNIETILQAATKAGLSSCSDFIRKTARDTVDIRLSIGDAGFLGSRFGGAPALPHGFEWPTHDMGRHQFLGQINFAEIEAPPAMLPSSGLLSLFFATDPDGEIFWQDPGYVVGYFFPDGSSLEAHASPDGSEPPVSRIWLERSVGLPSSPDLKLDHPLPQDDQGHFFDALPGMMDAPTDYLLGYPSFNTLAYDPTPGDEWISLMTLCSHDQLGWCWNDGDKLMIFIEKQKLLERDFSDLRCEAG